MFDNLDRAEKPCFSQLFKWSFCVWFTCNYLAFVTYALLKKSPLRFLIQSNCSFFVCTKSQTHIWTEWSLYPVLCMHAHGIIIW